MVFDTWSWEPSAVERSSATLVGRVDSYIYVLSRSVYDAPEAGANETWPTVHGPGEDYARCKLGGEQAAAGGDDDGPHAGRGTLRRRDGRHGAEATDVDSLVVADRELLSSSDLFADLTPEELDAIVAAAVQRQLERGDVLFTEDDESNELFVVDSGRLAMTQRSQDGRESVIALMEQGELFGEMPLFDGLGQEKNPEWKTVAFDIAPELDMTYLFRRAVQPRKLERRDRSAGQHPDPADYPEEGRAHRGQSFRGPLPRPRPYAVAKPDPEPRLRNSSGPVVDISPHKQAGQTTVLTD